MKKNSLSNYLIILSILTVLLTIVSIICINTKNNKKDITEYEEVVLEPQKEEIETFTKEILNNPNNYIKIDSILYNRLMDDDGSYYYLNHNLNGEYDQIGIPIVDERTDFTHTRKTLVYAHSTTNGKGPFQVLQNYYQNYSFYNDHKYIEINYNDKIHNYVIFSVYVQTTNDMADKNLEYFNRVDYNDHEWLEALNNYKSKSDYETGIEINKEDKIIILQTCSMDPNYYEKFHRYNLLIFAKEI